MRHLQLLVALDDYHHMGRVASLLNVTQPALSKILAELETGLGAKLFTRKSRGLQPTDHGEVLISYARRLLTDLTETGDELHTLSTRTARRIRIGTLPATASSLLPRALAKFKSMEPEAPVFVREATMDLLEGELRMGYLDVIVGTLPSQNTDLPPFEERPLFDGDTVLVVRPDHPLTSLSTISW